MLDGRDLIIIALDVFRVTVTVVGLSDTCIISVKDDGQSSCL